MTSVFRLMGNLRTPAISSMAGSWSSQSTTTASKCWAASRVAAELICSAMLGLDVQLLKNLAEHLHGFQVSTHYQGRKGHTFTMLEFRGKTQTSYLGHRTVISGAGVTFVIWS